VELVTVDQAIEKKLAAGTEPAVQAARAMKAEPSEQALTLDPLMNRAIAPLITHLHETRLIVAPAIAGCVL